MDFFFALPFLLIRDLDPEGFAEIKYIRVLIKLINLFYL